MDEEIIVEGSLDQDYNDCDGPRAYTYRIVRVSQPEEEISEPNDELE